MLWIQDLFGLVSIDPILESNSPIIQKELTRHSSFVQKEALYASLRRKYQSSLYYTAKDLLGYHDITHYTHDETISALESPTKRKLICIPRGCFKSSIGVVSYPIWCLLRDPNLRIMIDSEIYENSKNFIREIRGKLESEKIVTLFGEFKSNQWAEGSITIKQRIKILKEASITASGVGTGKTGQHYDIIIHDDLNSVKNSDTQEQRQKIINHYKLNTSILEPHGVMAIIGTRYASDDVIGWVMENEINQKGLLFDQG